MSSAAMVIAVKLGCAVLQLCRDLRLSSRMAAGSAGDSLLQRA